jgi:hypothetical protein
MSTGRPYLRTQTLQRQTTNQFNQPKDKEFKLSKEEEQRLQTEML